LFSYLKDETSVAPPEVVARLTSGWRGFLVLAEPAVVEIRVWKMKEVAEVQGYAHNDNHPEWEEVRSVGRRVPFRLTNGSGGTQVDVRYPGSDLDEVYFFKAR
jgi:hypothetical protein